MPLKPKDLAKICESTEFIFAWLINLNLLFILNSVYANFVKLGVLDFEKIPPLAGIITFGDVQTKNVIKKFPFEKDRTWFENHNRL